MLLGVVCIVGDVTTTFATIQAFGWLLRPQRCCRFDSSVSHADLEWILPLSAQCSTSGIHWISADSLSIGRSDQLQADSCVVLHCRRAVPRSRCGNGEVPVLGLVGLLRDRLGSAGDYVTRTDAGFQGRVHRICHWRRHDRGRRITCRFRHCNTQLARAFGLQSCVRFAKRQQNARIRAGTNKEDNHGTNAGCGL